MKELISKIYSFFFYWNRIRSWGVTIRNSNINSVNVSLFKNVKIRNCTVLSNCKIHENSSLNNVKLCGYNRVGSNCMISNCTIDKYSYVGNNVNMNNTVIGKFCSISSNIQSGLGNHPISFISTSPFFYSPHLPFNPFLVEEVPFEEYLPITIQNDVWIGTNVFIKDGVTICNGAIVAAGSIVVNNVPPYAIVGGVPAKVLRFRHSEEKIKMLIESNWWNNDEEWFKSNLKAFQSDMFNII